MKSSMTFFQSNGWTEIDLIYNKYGGGLYDDRSALNCYANDKAGQSTTLDKYYVNNKGAQVNEIDQELSIP